jgi:hypothetical protein
MGIFGSKKHKATPTVVVRSGTCVYQGEPFPTKGEPMETGGQSFRWIANREDLPAKWVDVAELIRSTTGEPRDRRVLVTVTGLLVSMVVGKLNQFEATSPEPAGACKALIVAGQPLLAPCREQLKPMANSVGDMVFDFEVLKVASMLTDPRSVSGRHEYVAESDMWAVDPRAYEYPY